jgi:hypothetical protein
VQGELESATHSRTVDERERRHRATVDGCILQPPEHPMAQPANLERLFARGDPRHAGDIGADAEHVRLAGQRDECRLGIESRCDRGIQAGQAARSERVRLGVVEPVVERDERGRSVEAGHADEP